LEARVRLALWVVKRPEPFATALGQVAPISIQILVERLHKTSLSNLQGPILDPVTDDLVQILRRRSQIGWSIAVPVAREGHEQTVLLQFTLDIGHPLRQKWRRESAALKGRAQRLLPRNQELRILADPEEVPQPLTKQVAIRAIAAPVLGQCRGTVVLVVHF